MIFSLDYAIQILPILLNGALITLEATAAGMALACVGGLVLAVLRMSPLAPVRVAATVFVEFVRSTPLLIQLFFLFYGLPHLGVSLSPLTAGFLGLGVHYSAYISEVYRAGISAVPSGQWEAALALNFTAFDTWWKVILPQAVPPVIPVIGNYLIAMFKDTPLLSTITVLELLGQALNEAGQTYRYFEPITLVGLIFLALSYPSALLVRRLERRFGTA